MTMIWVRHNDEVGWCAGIGSEVMFSGFKDEAAAWTWLRAHLADKYDASLRAEERRVAAAAETRDRQRLELTFALDKMPVPSKKKELH